MTCSKIKVTSVSLNYVIRYYSIYVFLYTTLSYISIDLNIILYNCSYYININHDLFISKTF